MRSHGTKEACVLCGRERYMRGPVAERNRLCLTCLTYEPYLDLLTTPPEWVVDAACAAVDPELWFPEWGEMKEAASEAAKRICREVCPVRDECLQLALRTNERHGIWGGLDDKERQELRPEGDVA